MNPPSTQHIYIDRQTVRDPGLVVLAEGRGDEPQSIWDEALNATNARRHVAWGWMYSMTKLSRNLKAQL